MKQLNCNFPHSEYDGKEYLPVNFGLLLRTQYRALDIMLPPTCFYPTLGVTKRMISKSHGLDIFALTSHLTLLTLTPYSYIK